MPFHLKIIRVLFHRIRHSEVNFQLVQFIFDFLASFRFENASCIFCSGSSFSQIQSFSVAGNRTRAGSIESCPLSWRLLTHSLLFCKNIVQFAQQIIRRYLWKATWNSLYTDDSFHMSCSQSLTSNGVLCLWVWSNIAIRSRYISLLQFIDAICFVPTKASEIDLRNTRASCVKITALVLSSFFDYSFILYFN